MLLKTAAILTLCLCIPAFAQEQAQPKTEVSKPESPISLPLTEKENAEYVKIVSEYQARQSDGAFAQDTFTNVLNAARKASTPVQFKTVGEQLRSAILATDAAQLGTAAAETQFNAWRTAVFKARGCDEKYTCTLDDKDSKNRRVIKSPKPVEAPKAEGK